jgi:hypothetical protein
MKMVSHDKGLLVAISFVIQSPKLQCKSKQPKRLQEVE